jgi:predicted ArsR family transcriptional regulator
MAARRSRLATRHQLGSSRQAISQHLEVLESAGLIETRREGRCTFHYVKTTPLRQIVERWSQLGGSKVRIHLSSVYVDDQAKALRDTTTAVLDDTCGNLIQIAQLPEKETAE